MLKQLLVDDSKFRLKTAEAETSFSQGKWISFLRTDVGIQVLAITVTDSNRFIYLFSHYTNITCIHNCLIPTAQGATSCSLFEH
jgi:hypothetical protein